MDGFIQALTGNLTSVRLRLSVAMPVWLLFISTILFAVGHQYLYAQQVTTEEPPAFAGQSAPLSQPTSPSASESSQTSLPAAPTPQNATAPAGSAEGAEAPLDLSSIPRASILPQPVQHVILESDTQSRDGDLYRLAGNVVITYRGHLLYADTVTYDYASGEITASGHVRLSGGDNDEYIAASRASYNIHTGDGRFYDVTGSVALRNGGSDRNGYVNSNPFLFSGRMVVKTGPTHYDIYDGAVTSCLLPNPDWQLTARHLTLDGGVAHAADSTFRLLGVPVLFLPYVTHPVNSNQRQSGFLIPVIGYSSASRNTGSKGLTLGDQIYLTLGRSADLTVGSLYYSLRGFSENSTFRYRGAANDFITAHFSALQDRGFTPVGGTYTNQGGEDFTTSFRRDLTSSTRAVGDAEYLSSYVYREVFTENFNQAVSSDITSTLYVTHQRDGYSIDGRFDRYEGLKVVPIGTTPGEEVKIFHAPSADFTALDHHIASTPLLWSMTASAAGLKRVQPNFATGGITERIDLRPELSLPLNLHGWRVFSSVAVRETAYSRSREAPYKVGAVPIELYQALNRSSVETNVDIRPPVIERTFAVPQKLHWLLGDEVRHTIEPDITYRDVQGIDNFLSILRFDDTDLDSDTNELKYGVTQHLYFRPRSKTNRANSAKPNCPATSPDAAAPSTGSPDALNPEPQDSNDANGVPNASATAPDTPMRTHALHADPCAPRAASAPPQQEWFSWQLAQKHFFNQTFGGAVIDQRRNIFDTTLSLSGIAFLTEARSISPLISRMRFRTSGHTDVEYDFDLDTGAKKFTSQNVFLDAHRGNFFGGFSYARLNAPGRTYTEVIDTTTNTATGLTSSAVSNFSQMRVLGGFGSPAKAGLSGAAGAGIDLNQGDAQYLTLQSSYNWNCCGLSVEYRRYDLGTLRDEGAYRFNFTLANIGTAGNLRRAESLF